MTANSNFALPIMSIGNIASFFLEVLLAFLVINAKKSGFFDNALMRGATRSSYILSRMVWYFLISLIFMLCFFFSNWILSVDTGSWLQAGLVFTWAYTLYLGFFASLVLVNPKWIILHFTLLGIVQLALNFSGGFAANISTEPGLGGMNMLTYATFYSPMAQYLIFCFLS